MKSVKFLLSLAFAVVGMTALAQNPDFSNDALYGKYGATPEEREHNIYLLNFFNEAVGNQNFQAASGYLKQLLDRCSQYGEKTAMVFSALTFALFHMNLFQFFYAFGMGLIFAYVYLRTRRLRYPVLMHMIINFMGSAVPLWVVSNLDLDALSNLNPQNLDQEMLAAILPGLLIYLVYVLVQLVLVIAGLVIGIVKRKSFTLQPTPEELPREGRVKTVYANVGFILFAILCAAVFLLTL